MREDAAPPDSVEVFCYSQHLRGLIRAACSSEMLECIENTSFSTRRGDRSLQGFAGFPGETWGLFFERLAEYAGAEAGERYRILRRDFAWRNKARGCPVGGEICRVKLPSGEVDASPAKGDYPSSSLRKKRGDEKALTQFYIFWISNRGGSVSPLRR